MYEYVEVLDANTVEHITWWGLCRDTFRCVRKGARVYIWVNARTGVVCPTESCRAFSYRVLIELGTDPVPLDQAGKLK